MKKILILLTFVSLITSCADEDNEKVQLEKPNSERLKVKFKKVNGYLVGVVNKESFTKDNDYNSWFNPNYENYTPNKEVLEELKSVLKGIEIQGFLGTWCPDSRREIPKFYKIMDKIKFKNFDIIAVDHSKKANGLEKEKDIDYVPTFILYKEGKEIGRFIERQTTQSLESDLLQIAQKTGYKPYR